MRDQKVNSGLFLYLRRRYIATTLVSLCVCALSQSVFATYHCFSQSAEVGCEVQKIIGAIILCSTLVEARVGDRKYNLNIYRSHARSFLIQML